MINIKRDWLVGGFAFVLALSLIFYLIPQYVDSPRAVRNVVLSPVFWPTIIAWLMLLIGGGILVTQYLEKKSPGQEDRYDDNKSCFSRVILFAVFLAGYYLMLPVLGMVWSSSAAFIIFSICISGTEHRKTAIVIGILLPVTLYAFFNHVAGVSVPQSDFMRLP